MSGLSKITIDRNQRILIDLVSKSGNDVCADCKARTPRWASHNLGIFICVNCASIHRKIGTHITKVKSVTMDSWTREQVEVMKSIGNVASNAKYNPDEARHPPPANREESERDSELEKFIRWKYEFKRFMTKPGSTSGNKPAHASSMLKPPLRPKSTPVASMERRSSPLPPLPTSPHSNPAKQALARPSDASYSVSSSPTASAVPRIAPITSVAPPWQSPLLSQVPGSRSMPLTASLPIAPTPNTVPAVLPYSATNPVTAHPVWNDMMSLANSQPSQQSHPHQQLPTPVQFQHQQLYPSLPQPGGSPNPFGGSASTPLTMQPLNPPSTVMNMNQFASRSVSLPIYPNMGTASGNNPFPMTQNLSLNTQPQPLSQPGAGMGHTNPFAQHSHSHGFQVPGQMQIQPPMNANGTPAFQPSSVPQVQSPFGQLSSSPFSHTYTPAPQAGFPQQQQQFPASAFPQQYGQQPSHIPSQPLLNQAFPQQQEQPMQGQGPGVNSFVGTGAPAWQQQHSSQAQYGTWGAM